jgi:hypothetical protein
MSETLLICDAPPRGILVLSSPGRLRREQRETLKRDLEHIAERIRSGSPPIILLEDGMTMQWLFPHQTWPDAEYSAA